MKQVKYYTADELIQTATKLYKNYNFNQQYDKEFFEELVSEFSGDLDVMNQLKQFHAWCIDQHPTQIKNIRLRFRSWLVNAHSYNNANKQVNGSPRPVRS